MCHKITDTFYFSFLYTFIYFSKFSTMNMYGFYIESTLYEIGFRRLWDMLKILPQEPQTSFIWIRLVPFVPSAHSQLLKSIMLFSTMKSRKGRTFWWDMREKPLDELRRGMSIRNTHPRENIGKLILRTY